MVARSIVPSLPRLAVNIWSRPRSSPKTWRQNFWMLSSSSSVRCCPAFGIIHLLLIVRGWIRDDALLGLVAGKHAASDPLLTDASQAAGAAEPICQVDHRHSLFSGVNRPRVGDAPISPGGPLRLGISTVPLEA